MPYPTSTDVTAGQPTAAAQYNNLRNDALYLGNPVTDSDLLANLLSAYQTGLTLQYLAANKVRVPASASAPVRLMLGGVILTALANVDLPAPPTGGAMWYYVFAVRTAGSTAFTLAINASSSETPTTRLVGQFYWDGSAVTRLQAKPALDLASQLFDAPVQVCQGRLTLTSATPVTLADVAGATMLYFTPYLGSYISLWEAGIGWRVLYFSELSLSLAGLAAAKNADVFIYNNAGAPALESLVWSSDSARAMALALQDGILVKSGDPTRRYLGTIRTTAVAGQTEDSSARRFVWNYANRVARICRYFENTAHSYASATQRKWNNSDTNNLLAFVVGVAEITGLINFAVTGGTSGGGWNQIIPVSDFNLITPSPFGYYGGALTPLWAAISETTQPGIGYHTIQTYEAQQSGNSMTMNAMYCVYTIQG